MSYLLDIATATPDHKVNNNELVAFYGRSLNLEHTAPLYHKLKLLNTKTRIKNRYSCIPDFNGNNYELFENGNYNQPIEKRTDLFKRKLMPLAAKAIDELLFKTSVSSNDITHLITVSCTGLIAPGFEFLVAAHYNLHHAEKSALNFLGCYAALKALKQAHYIAQSNKDACILIVIAELCSLHFTPSASDEDIVANLLFADGAAAAIVCGNNSKHVQHETVLNIDAIGSAYIPDTLDLMTWNISSTAFKMYLNKNLVEAIEENIRPVVTDFLINEIDATDYWAIHPGGVRIVEAVKRSLELNEKDVFYSLKVLEENGNMSSATILFVLDKIFKKIKADGSYKSKNIFACAFGPGLNIEMISFSSVSPTNAVKQKQNSSDYVQAQIG